MMHQSYLLPHLLLKTVFAYSGKAALIIDDEHFTYQLLYEDINRFFDYLQVLGLSRNDRVIIQAGNSYMTIVAFWAVLFCEAIPCIIDIETTGDRLENMINSIQPKINIGYCISDTQFDIYMNAKINFINELCERIAKPAVIDKLSFRNTESDVAMILHTSGSTGNPKGVMLSHRNVLSAIESIQGYLSLNKSDTILSVLPVHFDYGLYQMLIAFSLGATLVLEKTSLFPVRYAHKISRYQATVLPCVPFLAQLFYELSQHYSYDFSTIRMVTNTGENLPRSHIEKLKKIFPSAQIFSMYGLTECKRCSYVPASMLDKKFDSIGIPMPNLEMWVQDQNGNRLENNIEGDLMIAGPTVMLGYWKNPHATSEKIIINAFGKRILKTGDRAVMDHEGYFYFKGRNDSEQKYKGIKIDCQNYVAKLNTIEAIERSYLFLDSQLDNNKLIVCAETNKKNYHDKLKLLIRSQFLKSQKPDHIFITTHFPLLSNGKIDKNTLEKNALQSFKQ